MDITNPYKWKGIWFWIIIWGLCFVADFCWEGHSRKKGENDERD